MTNPIYDRVKAGAELLDEVKPGWFRSINLDKLDIASVCNCILGQSFGSFSAGTDFLKITGDRTAQEEYGFELTLDEYDSPFVHDIEREYANVWADAIGNRL